MERQEVTEGEIELCYRLGEVGEHCAYSAEVNLYKDVPGVPEADVEVLYSEFREIARTFNIVLPEQLPHRYETIHKQLLDVGVRFQDKNKHLRIAFRLGMLLENLRLQLILCSFEKFGKKFFPDAGNVVESIAEDLQLMADEKGVDISEELRTLANRETELLDFVDIKRLKLKLKMKLCSLATNESMTSTKRSAIDPTRMISNDYWVISLVRLPDRGNSEHAFLVLEAKTGTTSKIWFIDFVAAQDADLFLPGIQDGKVRIEIFQSEEAASLSTELLFQCRKTLMDVRRNDRLLYSSWPIPKPTAEVFLQNVEARQERPPKYNILGDSMLAGSSATSSSKAIGHNCFTFAKKMLLDLNDPYIQLPADKIGEWVFSATSRFLVDPMFERHKWQGTRFPIAMLFVFLAGMAVSYIILKLLP